MSPNAAIAWLRRRWWVVAAFVGFMVVMVWTAVGAVNDSNERRASRARIEGLAREVRDSNARIEDQNALIVRIASAIDSATSQEARDRSSVALAGAIADLRRSIDCVGIYVLGERPTPCADVAARMDALRAGLDPFARPAPPAPAGGST